MDHLECVLTKLTETVERVARVWEEDLRWRKGHESSISREDQQSLQLSLMKGQRILRRVKLVARALASLDAQTNPNQKES